MLMKQDDEGAMKRENSSGSTATGYGDKHKGYFENVRLDAVSLVPENTSRVIEIGCGTGSTLAWLKANKGCAWATGVELFHDAAAQARTRLDEVYEGNIENLDLSLEEGSFDVVLCLDVLEHMVDPWTVMQRITRLLKPGGVVIASIPNARHLRVVVPLVLLGKWEYSEEGLLDETHLRFFTRRSAIELMMRSGLTVDAVRGTNFGRKYKVANAVTLSLFKPFLTPQYLIRAIA